MCIGTELYVMFLQAAGLIKVFDDTMQDDPYNRECVKVRLIQCAVVHGYEIGERMATENKICGETTDLCVLHGTHALSVAAVLEAGGSKGSRVEGEHEFSTLGLYPCPDGELTPFPTPQEPELSWTSLKGSPPIVMWAGCP
jgi:hypothetical protein